MLDFSVWELILIAVVALVVIGPERLPKVARTAGVLLGRLQRYVAEVKADISREMELEELSKLQTEVHDAARSVEQSVSAHMREAEEEVNKVTAEARSALSEPALSETPPASVAEPASATVPPVVGPSWAHEPQPMPEPVIAPAAGSSSQVAPVTEAAEKNPAQLELTLENPGQTRER
jgi:sec-independent protein translocase protein TatB